MRWVGSLLWCSLCQPAIAGEVVLRNPAMTVTVDPSTLELRVTPTGKTEIMVSAPSPKAGQVSNLQQSESRASWRLSDPGLAVTLDLEADGLEVRFRSDEVGELSWPIYSPLHRELGLLPLTGFQWLTADRTVQQTVFGDRVQLVANFGEQEYRRDDLRVPTRSVVVRWPETGRQLLYTASSWQP